MNTELAQADLHPHLRSVSGHRLLTGEKGKLGLALSTHVKGLDTFEPAFLLRIVDLAQIEDVPLHATASGTGHLFADAIVLMLLAVFEPRMTFEVHALAEILSAGQPEEKGVGL